MYEGIFMKAVFCAVNSKFIHTCLAAHILINHIDKSIFDVNLWEYSINDEIDIILKNIARSNADVYMFSVYIFNVEFIKRIISKLKKINPACKIILGGPEVSFDCDAFLKNNTSADFIIIGEGELVLDKLLTAIKNDSGLDAINNIAYRQGNEIISTNKSDELISMDDIIFPYNSDNLKDFKNKIIYYESSRGCPYSCAYCMSANDKHMRYKSLAKVFNELTFFIENKVSIVKFTDRTFNADDIRAQKIWQFILDNNICTTFHFEISADILSDDSISLLNKLPLHYVQLEAGVQSAKQQTLKAVNRKTNLDKLANNLLRLTEANNMHIHTDLIAGLPYESYEDFKSSFNFVYTLNSHMIQLGFLKILKGSPMEDMVKDGGYVYDDYAPYEIIKNNWISYDEIQKLKLIESLADRYYNCQSFAHILNYIIENYYKDNEFGFYEELGEFFNKNHYSDAKMSKSQLYTILYDFLMHKSISDNKTKALLSFDFLLNNSSPLPKSLYLNEITKNALYELIQNNIPTLPPEYKNLPYKQLIKHLDVYEFELNPINLKTRKTYIAFFDIKQNCMNNNKKYVILNSQRS